MCTRIVVLLCVALIATTSAARGKRVAPVTDPVVKQECGSCHMVFPPQFLPKRSWQKLVETLADHFGENASLDDAQRQAVLAYLLAHAADSRQAGREGRKFASEHRRRADPSPHHGHAPMGDGNTGKSAPRVEGSRRQVEGELSRVSQGGRARRV